MYPGCKLGDCTGGLKLNGFLTPDCVDDEILELARNGGFRFDLLRFKSAIGEPGPDPGEAQRTKVEFDDVDEPETGTNDESDATETIEMQKDNGEAQPKGLGEVTGVFFTELSRSGGGGADNRLGYFVAPARNALHEASYKRTSKEDEGGF
eukprot:Gb_36601 [translate_table: standard]